MAKIRNMQKMSIFLVVQKDEENRITLYMCNFPKLRDDQWGRSCTEAVIIYYLIN